MWRCIDMYDLLDTPTYVTELMCRDAVDRSVGCLDEITLRSFCSDELLRYVADRAPQLRILRLSCCYNLYEEGLSEVAKKLQNLEELHIICTTVSKEDVKSFGHCCTQLISLTYTYNYTEDEGDEAALAISQTMPGLRHLSMCKNKLTNNGLLAILNKCPHLESLDLRSCRNVNLEGDFGKTCAERIKNLKLPHDPIDGCKNISIRSNEFGYDSFDDEISIASTSSVSSQESYDYYDDEDDLNDDDEDDYSSRSSLPVRTHRPPPPNWLDLPAKATKSILHRLGAIEILEVAQKVCLTWRVVCKHPSMWRSIDMHNLGDLHNMPYDLKVMCRHAVDRSYGRLNHINLEYFADVDLLDHIAERAPQLRSLRLACCYGVYAKELCDVAKKLPILEELHMFLSEVPKEALESFGQYCPHLISLTYNIHGMRITYSDNDSNDDSDYDRDGEAQAIACTMPGLRHLSLFGNQMTNHGLKVILNKCPLLESLDLRQCFNVNLEGALGRTCAQQIKNLKHPNDSTDGYGYDTTVYCSNDDDVQFSSDSTNFGDYFYGWT